jgi:hypothetical protein
VCFCGAAFRSARGLGQHNRHRHPLELNETRKKLLPFRKRVWEKYEDSALIRLANEIAQSNTTKRDLSYQLTAHFLGRSAEAILSRLKVLKWSKDHGQP